jgi:hypothetical protein
MVNERRFGLTVLLNTRSLNLKRSGNINTMICIPIARQRLGKRTPAGANARNSRTSIARQRISKQASLTIEAVFSAWSVQNNYKEVFGGIEQDRTEVKIQVSGPQPARIWAWEQRNWIESSLRNWQLQNNDMKQIMLWKKKTSCVLKWQWVCYEIRCQDTTSEDWEL